MIFAKKSFFSFLLILSSLCIVIYWNVKIESKDLVLFDEIKKISKALGKSKQSTKQLTEQTRDQSQKDFWVFKGEKNEHLAIFAKSSKLIFRHVDFKFQAQELLTNVHGFFSTDNEVNAPHFEAKTAKADYTTHQLFIDEMILTTQDGILQATHANFVQNNLETPCIFSDGVTFYLKRNDDLFSISSNQASLHLKNEENAEKTQCIDFLQDVCISVGDKLKAYAEKAKFTENEIVLSPSTTDGNCHISLSEDLFIDIFSKSAKVFLEDKKPQKILIEDEIHMESPSIQNKPSHAIADILIYDLLEKKIYLKAKENKRVLFWQDDLKLSAPEIIISKDPLTQKDVVEAKGDLRISFDHKETKRIEDILKRYL